MADDKSAHSQQNLALPDDSPGSPPPTQADLSRANSARTWAYTSQNNPPPPVIPHPPPHPASPPYTYNDRQSEGTDVYMNISSGVADIEAADINCGNDYANGTRKRSHNIPFVGGFVSGLKRLPRAVKGPRNTRPRRGTGATEGTDNTILPTYHLRNEQPFHAERAGDPTNIVYVQGSEMPDHTSYLPRRRSSQGPNTEEAAFTIHPDTVVDDVGAPPVETPSRRFGSSRHTSLLLGSDVPRLESQHPEPPRAPDYAQMPYSPRTSVSGTFLSQGLPGLLDFFRHLYEMPWMADHRIVEDYHPGQALPDQGRKKAARVPKSWYTPVSVIRHPSLQLDLSGSKAPSPIPRPPRTAATHARHRRHGQSRHDRHRRSSSSPDYIPRSRARHHHHHRAGTRRHSGHGASHASPRTSPRGSSSSGGGMVYSPTMQPQPFYIVPSPPNMYAAAPGSPNIGQQAQGMPASPSTLFMVPVIPPIYPGNGQMPGHLQQGRDGQTRYPMHSTPAPSATAGHVNVSQS